MNPKTIISLLAIAVALTRAGAQTNEVHFDVLRTLDGETFTNATVTRMSDVFAIVSFGAGGKKVPFTNLPTEIQRVLGFDPAKAQAEIELENRKKQESKQRQIEAMQALQEVEKARSFRYYNDRLFSISVYFTNLRGNVFEVLSNGILFVPFVRKAGSAGPVNYYQSIGAYAGPVFSVEVPGEKTVFIRCPTNGIVDGQEWDGLCIQAGTFTYRATDGSHVTVEKYDTGLAYPTRADVVLHQVPQYAPRHRRTAPANNGPWLRPAPAPAQ